MTIYLNGQIWSRLDRFISFLTRIFVFAFFSSSWSQTILEDISSPFREGISSSSNRFCHVWCNSGEENYFYFSGFDVCVTLSVCLFVRFRCQVCLFVFLSVFDVKFVCLSVFDVNLWLVSISRVNRSGTCESVRIVRK